MDLGWGICWVGRWSLGVTFNFPSESFSGFARLLSPEKKKTSPLKNRHHSKPLRRWCFKTQNHQKVQWKMLALEALQVPRFCQFQDFLRWHNLDLVDVVFFDRKKSGFSDGMNEYTSQREDMSVLAIYHCGYVLFCFRTCTFCCKVAGIQVYATIHIKYCYFNLHFKLFHQSFSPNLEAWVLSFQLTWTDKRLYRFASTTVTYDTTPTNLCISDFLEWCNLHLRRKDGQNIVE